MKTKILSLFALIFLMSFVSAVTLSEWPLTSNGVAINVNSDVNTGTFVSNGVIFNSFNSVDGANAENWSLSSLDTSKYFEVTISPGTGKSLTISDISFGYGASITGPASLELRYSKQSGFTSPTTLVTKNDVNTTDQTALNSSLNVQVNSGETLTLRWFGYDFSATTNEFHIKNLLIQGTSTDSQPQDVLDCQAIGNPGNLEIKNIDFANNGLQYNTFGEDDEWFPFEEIEVEVEIESDDYDIDDISVEWGIYSIEDGEWLIDIDEETEFNLKDGDKETLLITFKLDDDLDIDLDEFVDNSNNYRFYVVANGVIDDNNAGVDDGEDTCTFEYESASIIIESDFVILDNIDMPETLSCGETVTVTADVWNIGDRDQDEVSVDIFGRESALGFSKTIEVGDMDAFDRQQISFAFTVPKNIDEKFYALTFEVNDEDGDIYENDFDEDTSKYTVPFKVEGSCGVSAEDVVISAHLESEAKEGEEMVIKATITNNGDELKTFTINAAEFAMWANLVSQDQSTLVLDSGQSKNVLFTFDINKDAVGTQTFFLELVSGDDVKRQPVSVNVEKSRSLLGITGFAIEGASLWGLGILNLVLIIIIIIVAVRIAKRK